MNTDEFRIKGKEAVDYIADYLENIHQKRVTPDVEPGYLRELIPKEAPTKGEKWDEIFQDFETQILPGITHWQHPRFHAYFPAGNCYPSIIAEMLSAGLGIVGFSWAASPSCTELETIVLEWLGRMLNLPKAFLPFSHEYEQEALLKNGHGPSPRDSVFIDSTSSPTAGFSDEEEEEDRQDCKGGGVILGSASECLLVSLLSARAELLRKLKARHPFVEDGILLSKLVMYTSKLAHSCVEKAGMIAMVKIRLLDTDENFSMRGHTVEKAIRDDRSNGFIPFFVACTFGTTSCCSFDNVLEIAPICNREEIYVHVDGAYAGSAMICEELRPHFKGIEHWGIALSRRFRSLKIWFTIRSYGVDGLQKYIREHIRLAKKFEQLILSDSRFEICGKVTLGLVCFRLKGPNLLSQNLLFVLNDSGKIHMVPAMLDDKYVIRFCVNAANATDDDMLAAWQLIRSYSENVLKEHDVEEQKQEAVIDQITSKIKRIRFGISKMVSEPRILNPKMYKRAVTTFRLASDSSSSTSPRSKYLARTCSIVESMDAEDFLSLL